jgi:hypothetical protein
MSCVKVKHMSVGSRDYLFELGGLFKSQSVDFTVEDVYAF